MCLMAQNARQTFFSTHKKTKYKKKDFVNTLFHIHPKRNKAKQFKKSKIKPKIQGNSDSGIVSIAIDRRSTLVYLNVKEIVDAELVLFIFLFFFCLSLILMHHFFFCCPMHVFLFLLVFFLLPYENKNTTPETKHNCQTNKQTDFLGS